MDPLLLLLGALPPPAPKRPGLVSPAITPPPPDRNTTVDSCRWCKRLCLCGDNEDAEEELDSTEDDEKGG